jgi:hypothetical protein
VKLKVKLKMMQGGKVTGGTPEVGPFAQPFSRSLRASA